MQIFSPVFLSTCRENCPESDIESRDIGIRFYLDGLILS
jgi:hypothetical protein